MGRQGLLDHGRVHLLPASVDHLVEPALDEQERVLVDQTKVAIAFDDEPLVERGMQKEDVRLPRIREIMKKSEYQITIDLGLGRGEDRVWTCDLSEEYVRLNAEYTT